MPASFSVRSSIASYEVEIAQGSLARLLAENQHAYILADDALRAHFPPALAARAMFIHVSEDAKEFAAIAPLLVQLRERKLTRSGLLLAVGGGVVQDIAGFIATIYMRGVPWVYAPSTLLGMVDSCIGGKSSINVQGVKNLVGTYFPPKLIAVDPSLADTLPLEARVAGLSEAVKICFAAPDDAPFDDYLRLKVTPDAGAPQLEQLISLTLATKRWFIETDEFDRKERLLLNFGHTFGHAIEAAGDYAIPHGIAVAYGMLCALELAAMLAPGEVCARNRALEAYTKNLLAYVPDCGAALAGLSPEAMLKAFAFDKKHTQDQYSVILPNPHGKLELTRFSRNDTHDRLLRDSLTNVMDYGRQIQRSALPVA